MECDGYNIDVSCLIVYNFIVMSFMFDDGCNLDGILYLMVDIVLMLYHV